jgi:type VI secretion system protein
MTRSNDPQVGFLEKMLGPLPGDKLNRGQDWCGDPVRAHLGWLLNARRGMVEHLPDYGLPDMASYYSDYPASLVALRTIVEELIIKYEPRLQNVEVRLLEVGTGEFRISLMISGEIEEAEGQTRVTYQTTISREGRTELSGL